MLGARMRPSRPLPCVSAFLISPSDHRPRPVSLSGVRFEPFTVYCGAWKVWVLPESCLSSCGSSAPPGPRGVAVVATADAVDEVRAPLGQKLLCRCATQHRHGCHYTNSYEP